MTAVSFTFNVMDSVLEVPWIDPPPRPFRAVTHLLAVVLSCVLLRRRMFVVMPHVVTSANGTARSVTDGTWV
jgi:hypothetical protein